MKAWQATSDRAPCGSRRTSAMARRGSIGLASWLPHICVLGIGCAAQNTASALVERHASVGGESVMAEHEPLVLPQKEHASASRHQALDLPLGALSVGAQPAEIVVPAGAEDEDVDLVVGDAGATALMEIADCPAAGAVEGGKVVEAVDCDSQVHVSALVQDFDPEPPEGLEAGQLVLERLGDRAEQGHRAHLSEGREGGRHGIRSAPKHRLTRELVTVLLGDLATGGAMGHDGDPLKAAAGRDAKSGVAYCNSEPSNYPQATDQKTPGFHSEGSKSV